MFNTGNCNCASVPLVASLNDGNNNNNGWGDNAAWWIVIFVLFFAFGGWGNGGWGGNGGGNGALTRSDLCQDMNFNNLESAVRGVQQGLCDGFYAQNTTMLNGFNGVQRDLCTGFSGVNAGVTNVGYQLQDCCCGINRNIDAVRYENAKNTCDIVNAINADGNATRALITQNQIQDLRDQLAERDRDLQSANFQISQVAQTNSIVNQIKPCPIPAYLSCSPYTSYNPYAYFGGNGFGGNCGCSGCNC